MHALEKEMAAHSSVLAWRIPGMGEPGGLPSMGSQSLTQLKQLSNSSSSSSYMHWGFPDGSVAKNLPENAGDVGSVPGSGRPPGERNGSPLQYSCLENPMDGGAWWATVHGITKSGTQLSN